MSSTAKKLEQQTTPSAGYAWNKRILIVEDEREIAATYKEILAPTNVVPLVRSSRSRKVEGETSSNTDQFQFDVVVTHSAEEAMTEVRKALHKGEPFAMGFFDVLLGPGKDGFELVKDIHQLDPELYAVFVTAYNDRTVDSIHNFLGEDKADHWDYLNKPFTSGEIVQKARNFVSLWNLQKEKQIHDQEVSEIHRRLLESERMSSVAAVARGVGHEFGNILMQIMGKADISLKKNEEGMREGLQKILDASHRANEILDRFKNLSQPVEQNSRKHPVLVHRVLDEALELMEHQLKTSGVKVCRIKTDKKEISVNSTSLIQVFINLTINSLHAMGNSGQIDFSLSDIGSHYEIRMRDYGPGIPAKDIDKVLLPFFTTKGDRGTGLGLAICKEIVEIEHRGEFQIQNHGVKGLEVVIRLPLSGGDNG